MEEECTPEVVVDECAILEDFAARLAGTMAEAIPPEHITLTLRYHEIEALLPVLRTAARTWRGINKLIVWYEVDRRNNRVRAKIRLPFEAEWIRSSLGKENV